MSLDISSFISDYYLGSLCRQNSNVNYLSGLYGQNSNVNYLSGLYGRNSNALYLGGLYCQNRVLDNALSYPSFQSVFAASISGQDFQGALETRFPGIKYHVMDTSKIDATAWERNDYPFERFFEDEVDMSVLDWRATSKEPSMLDRTVQAKLNAARGKYAVLVPPQLEERLQENPSMAQELMDKIFTLMAQQDPSGTIESFNIAFDDNGNISNYRFSGGGGRIDWPSEEEQRKSREEHAKNMQRQTRRHYL